MKEVIAGNGQLYSISNRDKAIATFKSLIVMAKADKNIDEQERQYLSRFAKSLGLTNRQYKAIAKEIDLSCLLDPFKPNSTSKPATSSRIIAIKENFDKIDDFTEVAREKDVDTKISGFEDFLTGSTPDTDIICFHAAENKDESVKRCKHLLTKVGDKTAAVLTRYQGHQVKYLREIGLTKCVIEPVYAHDIDNLIK